MDFKVGEIAVMNDGSDFGTPVMVFEPSKNGRYFVVMASSEIVNAGPGNLRLASASEKESFYSMRKERA